MPEKRPPTWVLSKAELQAEVERLERVNAELLADRDHLGFARWRYRGDNQMAYLSLCDSCDPGAFKIYRYKKGQDAR